MTEIEPAVQPGVGQERIVIVRRVLGEELAGRAGEIDDGASQVNAQSEDHAAPQRFRCEPPETGPPPGGVGNVHRARTVARGRMKSRACSLRGRA